MSDKTTHGAVQVRWTIETAGREFDIDPKTLSKRLIEQDCQPGEDKKFSTPQIIKARFTDYKAAQARKMAAEARMAERADKRDAAEVIDSILVSRSWESVIVQVKQRVQLIPSKLQSRLSLTKFQKEAAEQECDDALAELSKSLSYTDTAEEVEQ